MSDPFLGEIKMVGFNFAPRGWASCQGQQMSIAQNTALFSLLGTTFGGNGQTTFGLPDFQGRSPVGMGQGPGLSPVNQGQMAGVESTVLSSAQLPTHNHVAQFTGQSSGVNGSLSANVDVATTTADPMVPPAAGATTYLSATSARAGLTNITINGLFTGTPPDSSKAHLGGVQVQTGGLSTTAAGSVAIGTAGGSLPVPLHSPYLGTNFIIALEGIFPSRP